MKIELKNIKHSPTLSDDSEAFTADLFVEGKKIATCKDDGNGGMIDVRTLYTEDDKKREFYREQLKKAEEYAKTLPAVKLEGRVLNAERDELPMDLELLIGELLNEFLDKKEVKRIFGVLDRASKKNVVLISKAILDKLNEGKPTNFPYRAFGWKRPIAEIPVEALRTQIPKLKAELRGDEVIYNKNIPVD